MANVRKTSNVCSAKRKTMKKNYPCEIHVHHIVDYVLSHVNHIVDYVLSHLHHIVVCVIQLQIVSNV